MLKGSAAWENPHDAEYFLLFSVIGIYKMHTMVRTLQEPRYNTPPSSAPEVQVNSARTTPSEVPTTVPDAEAHAFSCVLVNTVEINSFQVVLKCFAGV